MKKLIILFLILNTVPFFGQVNIKLFTNLNDYIINSDIIHCQDGIWLLKKNYNNESIYATKVNKDNVILAETEGFELVDVDDAIFYPSFLGHDTLNNVYLYNTESVNGSSNLIAVYKINPTGEIVWKQTVEIENLYGLISDYVISENILYCIGIAFDETYEVSKPLAFSIDILSGEMIWQKLYDFPYISAFFSICEKDTNNFMVLLYGIDNEENYLNYLFTMDKNGIVGDSIKFPVQDIFAKKIIKNKENEFIIGAYYEGNAQLFNFDIQKNEIIWQNSIFDGWDDSPIFLIKRNNKIITGHTTFGNPPQSPGSGIEGIISLFDLNGNMIDTICMDYNTDYETQLFKLEAGNDGMIYLCGIDISTPSGEQINSWWGYFDPETSFISGKTTISKSKNVILFPNICNYGDQVFFESDNFIEEIQIVGINGTQVGKIQSNTHSGSITIPDIHSGLYLLIFKSENSYIYKKLLIK